MTNQNNRTASKYKKWFVIFSLVLAGEIIFGLPFHLSRFFRPTMLSVFDITNAELGDAIAVYGITAMISYFPSGIIADRFSARKLMSFSLVATALGGVWMSTIPNKIVLYFLYGLWGVTTILLFWSAMIKATRDWGGHLAQGRAFGFLDGGRGLVAAGVASLGVLLLSWFFTSGTDDISETEKVLAFRTIIWLYTILAFGAAVLVWLIIPETKSDRLNPNPFKGLKKVLKSSSTWLIAFVVVCSYCGFKALDFYGLYLIEAFNFDEVEASRFVTNASYLRPVAAIGAGFIADRFSAKRTIITTFIVLISVYFFMSQFVPEGIDTFLTIALLITFASVYALRGIYFALLEEAKVPENVTGTTVGIVSFLGFTPDVFFNSVAGRIIDNSPGIEGFQNFYLLLLVFATGGLIFSILLRFRFL